MVAYARTPMGNFQGTLSSLTTCELGGIAIRAAVEKAGLSNKLDCIDEVIMGNVLSAGIGQAPATTAARLAGIPSSVPATAVNKVCASAIMLAANSIKAGEADIIVAGGMESMSRVPYLLPSAARTGGFRFGDQTIVDCLRLDGLVDTATGMGMGLCGEKCSTDFGITREESDTFAKQSYERAIFAQAQNFFSKEITPVEIPSGKGKVPPTIFNADEGTKNYNPEKMVQLKSTFQVNGTVTAANASPMSDGAAALVICSGDAVIQHNLPVLARILGWADASCEGIDFTIAPSLAIPKALNNAKKRIEDVEFFEINEAFSAVALANMKILGLSPEKVNVWGGAVSLGHPLGCSGARITGTLGEILRQNNGTIGVAAICNGGGGASAIVLENIS